MLNLLALAATLGALREADARVAAIAWRLQTVNASLCSHATALPGFSIETLDQYAASERAEATAEFGLGDLPQISAIVPGSAAAKAGLEAGDELVAVDGQRMPRAIAGKSDYGRTALVEKALEDALAHPPVTLTLAKRTVTFSGDRGCPSAVQLVPGGRLDAAADGHYVQVSGVLYQFVANDSELAFVIAHELAHNVVPEARRADAASQQRRVELAADRAAIAMMAHAGYDMEAVVPLMERVRRKNLLAWLDGSHPGWAARIAAVRAAISEQQSIRHDPDQMK